jgi:hypothetical protein
MSKFPKGIDQRAVRASVPTQVRGDGDPESGLVELRHVEHVVTHSSGSRS